MDDRAAMLEMISRFGAMTTLDLMLAELHNLRSQLADTLEQVERVDVPEPTVTSPPEPDVPGQLHLFEDDKAA